MSTTRSFDQRARRVFAVYICRAFLNHSYFENRRALLFVAGSFLQDEPAPYRQTVDLAFDQPAIISSQKRCDMNAECVTLIKGTTYIIP